MTSQESIGTPQGSRPMPAIAPATETGMTPASPWGASPRIEGLETRFWQPGDTDAINALFNDPSARPGAAAAGTPDRTNAQWMWEFASSSLERPPYTVATHENRIVGTQAYIPIELLHDGSVVPSGKDEDTLIHPRFRGMGLLDEMYGRLLPRARTDGVAVLWGFTNTAVRPLIRNGYRSIGRFEVMRAKPFRHKRRRTNVTVTELPEPDERCDRFSIEFGRRVGGLTLHLSARYLRWRVCENPFRRYHVFAAFEEDRIVGLSVFKIEDKQAAGMVSELVAIPTASHDTADILNALLLPGLELFRSRGYSAAEARPSGQHPFNRIVRTVLARHGFESVPAADAPEFLVLPMAGDDPRFLNMERWRITELMREY